MKQGGPFTGPPLPFTNSRPRVFHALSNRGGRRVFLRTMPSGRPRPEPSRREPYAVEAFRARSHQTRFEPEIPRVPSKGFDSGPSPARPAVAPSSAASWE